MPRRKPPTTIKPDAVPVFTSERYKGAVRVMSPEPENSGASELLRLQALDTPARPRWEYRTFQSNDGPPCWFDTSEGQQEPYALNDLGADGWELVTIYPVGDALHAPVYYAVFKRVKE